MGTFVGIHQLLATLPMWLTAFILVLFTDSMIHLLRDKLEGLGYQTAFSAKFGDVGLVTSVLIGVTILQRGGAHVPEWLQSGEIQGGLAFVCAMSGVMMLILTFKERSGRWGDIYHDCVVVPAILFLAVTLLPVAWYSARWYELAFIAISIVTWVALIVVDLRVGRFNQRQWLVGHGFPIAGEAARH